jgi:14-3-3 protein epsilon
MTDKNSTIILENFGEVTSDQLVELIRVAETAERYEDMCKFVKQLVITRTSGGKDLDVEERNLLSVAYKNVVGSKRASWRTLSGGFDDVEETLIEKYKKIVEDELEKICKEVIDLLINNLIKQVSGKNDETEVFYLKMTGDYYRYLSEFRSSEEEYKNKAKEYYQKALDVATDNLPETHPTRLGLALNFSVCYYEILKQPEKACELAKKSFDSAIEKLDTLNDSSYKDSTLIMQLLRDNLTLWTSEQNDEEE